MTQNPKSPEKQSENMAEAPVSVVATPQNETTATPLLDANGHPLPPEYGGRKGPEATRFGDWEMNGKCVDF